MSYSIIDLFRPHKKALCLGAFLLVLTNAIVVSLPLLLNGGVSLIEYDRAFAIDINLMVITFSSVYIVVFVIILLAAIGTCIRTVSRMVIFNIGRIVERDLRARLFFHLSTLDDQFYLKNSVGDLMNHLTTDIANVRMITGFAVLNIMNIVLVFCITVPLLLNVDVMLAIVALSSFPLVIIATHRITKTMFNKTINYQKQLSATVSHIQENLLGAHVVRLFHQQHNESLRFKSTNQKTYDAGIALAKARVLMFPVMRLMVGLSIGLVLLLGGQAIISGRISLGDFVEINARILQLAWPAMSVGFVLSVFSRGQASLSRINHLLMTVPAIPQGNRTINDVQQIEVRNLSLSSDNNAISFLVTRGDLLGVAGPTGSYKTSLLRALSKRSPVPDGTIFYNGVDINELSSSMLYDHVSIVSQETFLFHKSIRENICFMRRDASSDDIDEVVNLTRLDRDVAHFTDGLDTVIGERGITLSGGQRQRVALARALLARRSVIILDDALSSVDADTEKHIVERIGLFLKDTIVIMVTHRLSALVAAEQILVMDRGRIIESGNHPDLMRKGQLYPALWGIDKPKGLGHE